MKNPYMKFQNPSMHGSEVMLCIKKRNGRTDTCTHKRPRSNIPLQLLQSWGHNDVPRSHKLNSLPVSPSTMWFAAGNAAWPWGHFFLGRLILAFIGQWMPNSQWQIIIQSGQGLHYSLHTLRPNYLWKVWSHDYIGSDNLPFLIQS